MNPTDVGHLGLKECGGDEQAGVGYLGDAGV